MGWTHYWSRDVELPVEDFSKGVEDFKTTLSKIDIPLAGPMSDGIPIINPTEIIFNGVKGQNCEPFSIKVSELARRSDKVVFSYCKTEKLPYDLCVKTVLVILKHYLGDNIKVMSDGNTEDWRNFDTTRGIKLKKHYF